MILPYPTTAKKVCSQADIRYNQIFVFIYVSQDSKQSKCRISIENLSLKKIHWTSLGICVKAGGTGGTRGSQICKKPKVTKISKTGCNHPKSAKAEGNPEVTKFTDFCWYSHLRFLQILVTWVTSTLQPAFLVKPCSNLEHVHRNTWKILTRKAASFAAFTDLG